jgi:hypothetical protein
MNSGAVSSHPGHTAGAAPRPSSLVYGSECERAIGTARVAHGAAERQRGAP